jgi:hypothetical protein
MTRPPRPVPASMKASELGADRLRIVCPECGYFIQLTDRYLERRWPGDRLLARIVTQHYCQRCSRGGRRVRPIGQIDPYPRSGAESADGPSKARG